MSLKYCDISTVVMTMNTEDFLAGWFDSTYTPVTERTWIQNRTNGGVGGTNWRFLKGTGLVVWRNQDINPIFNGMISGFKATKTADGLDTCEITFSSDELLLAEHIAFPDILSGVGQNSGQRLPDSNGIWGYTGYGDGDWGSQWGTAYNQLADSQEAQMKYFVQDQIGQNAPSTATTNRKLSVLKVQDMWNSSDGGDTGGYGDVTLLTDILESILDVCKYCVVPQPYSDAHVYEPRDEVRFWVQYLIPPSSRSSLLTDAAQHNHATYAGYEKQIKCASTAGFTAGDVVTISDTTNTETNYVASVASTTDLALTTNLAHDYHAAGGATISYPYYLEFKTQTATNTAYRAALAAVTPPAGFSVDAPGHQADVAMGEHDKRATCVFSERTGTVVEVDYEELRPELNQSFVIGPTPNADTYASTSDTQGSDWIDAVVSVDFGAQETTKWRTNTQQDTTTTTVTDYTTDIDHRLYKKVTGDPITLSQDVYGVIEGTFEHSTGEADTKTNTLNMMKWAGRADINEKLFNIYYKATVRENDVLRMSPDDGMQNYFIGDYVKVITEYGNIENLVREINLKVDSNGEVMESIIGTPMAAYGNWWAGSLRAKLAEHHARRTSRHHYHRSR